MQIYIPKYLGERIPILKQLSEIVTGYGKKYSKDEDIDSFSDYKYSLRNDSVVRFLDYVIPDIDEFKSRFPDQDETNIIQLRNNHISYLTVLFYSVKGTYKVLDYITEYDLFQTSKGKKSQGQDLTTKIAYTTKSISIEIQSIPVTLDRGVFCSYLEKFLNELLYFEFLTINIKTISAEITDSTTTTLNHGDAYYQYYQVNIKEEDL
jgi:hypothetical protein